MSSFKEKVNCIKDNFTEIFSHREHQPGKFNEAAIQLVNQIVHTKKKDKPENKENCNKKLSFRESKIIPISRISCDKNISSISSTKVSIANLRNALKC